MTADSREPLPLPVPSPNPDNLADGARALMVGLGGALLARPQLIGPEVLQIAVALLLIGGSLGWSAWANKQTAIRLAQAMVSRPVVLK